MTLEEAQYCEVTKQEAIREILKHGVNPAEFLAEVGDKETYTGEEVLNWLGY